MIISIEGNIGSGKSTFCKFMKDHFSKYYNKINKNVYFLDEPVDEWINIKDEDGSNLLEKFYNDQSKYSFCFQMTAYISRLAKLKETLKKYKNDDDIIITERCVYSDANVFAKMLYDSKKINTIEYQIYLKWFDFFMKDIPPIFYVYIDTNYQNCYDRIKIRSRNEEETISKDYLKSCEEYHNKWLMKEECKIILDGNKDASYHAQYLDIVKQMIYYDNTFLSANENDLNYKYYRIEKIREIQFRETLNKCQDRAKKLKVTHDK